MTALAREQMLAIAVPTSTLVRTVPIIQIPQTPHWYKKNVFSLVNIAQLNHVVTKEAGVIHQPGTTLVIVSNRGKLFGNFIINQLKALVYSPIMFIEHFLKQFLSLF